MPKWHILGMACSGILVMQVYKVNGERIGGSVISFAFNSLVSPIIP